MITVKLIGGLGNQMFQYACARRLALKNGVKLKLDLTFLLNRLPRKIFMFRDYELGAFKIDENFTCLSKISFYFKNLAFIIQFIKNKLVKFFRFSYLVEEINPFYFEPRILNLGKSAYLSGQWAHEKYFVDIAETIRQDFTLKKQLDGKNKELADIISSTNSVSIHVRRGDYTASGVEQTCNLSYYQRAIDYIFKKVSNPVFFIFSDEPKWIKENFKVAHKCIVVENNKNPNSYFDIILMSLCKHNIVAESTFSWWGAWLNTNCGKIIIAPKKWNNMESYADNVFANSWIKI